MKPTVTRAENDSKISSSGFGWLLASLGSLASSLHKFLLVPDWFSGLVEWRCGAATSASLAGWLPAWGRGSSSPRPPL